MNRWQSSEAVPDKDDGPPPHAESTRSRGEGPHLSKAEVWTLLLICAQRFLVRLANKFTVGWTLTPRQLQPLIFFSLCARHCLFNRNPALVRYGKS